MPQPAYTRLHVDERRRRLIDAAAHLFAAHAFGEISMARIAQEAGVSKALLYHYFPSKADLFAAAIEEYTRELAALVEPREEDGAPVAQLAASIDRYLTWIEANAGTWAKLMRSAASAPEATGAAVDFRSATMARILERVVAERPPPAALRNALEGWLGYADAAILDWLANGGLERDQLAAMLIAAFGAALMAAQQADPRIRLDLG